MRRVFAILFFAQLSVCAAAVTREEVEAGAAQLYRERLQEAEQKHDLDTDAAFLLRVRQVAEKLIAQAGAGQGDAAAFTWEIHTVGDPEENASCMAGGKLLVGQTYVRRLELNDAELAMLIAHEMAHALLQHNVKEMREAQRIDPQWQTRPFSDLEYAIDHNASLMGRLDAFNAAQEFEADREGLLLANRAGWPAAALANYFRKMVRADPMANFDRAEHPSPAMRRRAIQSLVDELERHGPAGFAGLLVH